MVDRELALRVKSLMPDRERDTDRTKPVSMWNELDRLRRLPEKTSVVIFRTRGCSWYDFTSCSMCGYFNDVNTNVNSDDLKSQIDRAYDFMESTSILKVFTSGSFLDRREIPREVFEYFFKKIGDKVDKLLIESRTEYVTEETLREIKNFGIDTRIAIGVESSNDDVIRKSVNKGSSFAKFKKAASTVSNLGLELRSYLLLKPPFMSEEEAVFDAIKSVKDCAPYSTDISINPMNIQRNTLVEKLWKNGEYRPPWLFSIAKVLLETRQSGTEVLSYPTGGDRDRGAHNDKQDPELLKLIFNSSLNQDFKELETYYMKSDLKSYELFLKMDRGLPSQINMDALIRKMSSGAVKIQ